MWRKVRRIYRGETEKEEGFRILSVAGREGQSVSSPSFVSVSLSCSSLFSSSVGLGEECEGRLCQK